MENERTPDIQLTHNTHTHRYQKLQVTVDEGQHLRMTTVFHLPVSNIYNTHTHTGAERAVKARASTSQFRNQLLSFPVSGKREDLASA